MQGTVAPLRATPRVSRSALGRDLLGVKSGLDTERAAGSTLAGKALTDRDANRLSLCTEPKLPTAASRSANGHSLIVEIRDQLRALGCTGVADYLSTGDIRERSRRRGSDVPNGHLVAATEARYVLRAHCARTGRGVGSP